MIPTGRTEEVCLTGKLIPWEADGPVFVAIPGSEFLFLPCFSSTEQLRPFMTRVDIRYESIKQIDDQGEFLSSFTPRNRTEITIILDPWYTVENRVRYLMIPWPDDLITEAEPTP